MASSSQRLPRELSYRTQVLTEPYKDQTSKLITRTFCDHEPMTSYLKISYADFELFATQVIENALKDQLSIIALNDNNQVIACAIVEDLARPGPLDFERLDPRFAYIFSLLEKLSSSLLEGNTFDSQHLAHLFITAVDADYQGKGLSKQINLASLHHAKSKGFEFMLCEFTNHLNEKGTVKHLPHDHLVINSYQYNLFAHNGEFPFKNLDGAATSYIWNLSPNTQLKYHRGDLRTHSFNIAENKAVIKLHEHQLGFFKPSEKEIPEIKNSLNAEALDPGQKPAGMTTSSLPG